MSGPCKLLVVGEAWGADELARFKQSGKASPFVGRAGYLLWDLMAHAKLCTAPPPYYPGKLAMEDHWEGLRAAGIYLTNVFQRRPGPESNKLEELCGVKTAETAGQLCTDLPPLVPSKYLRAEFRGELERLEREITELRPNLVLLLGATALWGVLQQKSISKVRGSLVIRKDGVKCLPTFHPSYILQGGYKERPTVIMDLVKARHEMQTAESRRIARTIHIPETVEDLWDWWERFGQTAPELSVDIETLKARWIAEIGFAASPTNALWVPFHTQHEIHEVREINGKTRKLNYQEIRPYWPDHKTEAAVWLFCRHVLMSEIPKLGQNYCGYDLPFLLQQAPVPGGIRTRKYHYDTLLAQHALAPGAQKSLGHMVSLYCDELAYKTFRSHTDKGEDAQE